MFRKFIWLVVVVLGILAVIHFPFSNPCDKPLTYSLGSFDERFHISRKEFLLDIKKAEKIWEDAAGKDLFINEESGGVKINLIYDNRQAATDKLRSIGITIGSDKEAYNSLKVKYDAYAASFNTEKAALLKEIEQVNADRDAYEKAVEYWNNRDGAPKNEYDKLEAERLALNSEIATVKQKQDTLNDKADTINSLATVINQLIQELNLNVTKYNSTAETTGDEFDEGIYTSSASGQKIDIYQFANEQKLVRVLAHELGHALGLGHVSDPKSIMYKLNQSTNEKPTASDTTELNKVCQFNK